MHSEISVPVFADAQGRYVRLPFTDGNSMLIALPTNGLTASTLTHAIQVLDARFAPTTVDLTLPRFTISTHVDLRRPLERVGITRSFGRDADYTPIFGRAGVALTEAYQQGAIAVDEHGARVSVVSLVGVEMGPHVVTPFSVDRPFAFAVEDAKTKQILVAGIVVRP